MNEKVTITLERFDVPSAAIWERKNYPDEGGLFLVSDGTASFIANVQKGEAGFVFSCALPAEIELNELKEKERIDIGALIEEQFKKLKGEIVLKEVLKEPSESIAYKGSISESGLIELAKILKK